VATDSRSRALLTVKLIHTVVWVFFVACIVAIPMLAWKGEFRWAAAFVAIVLVEVLVLVLNRWSCPLTPVAARFTDDRRANFDIFLPEWLARHNQVVFGTLYVAGIVYLVVRWVAERS
jgi:predicted MFS family arabinose efflux permease